MTIVEGKFHHDFGVFESDNFKTIARNEPEIFQTLIKNEEREIKEL